MPLIDFMQSLHKKTKRDYLERVTTVDKAECALVAKKFDSDYWDGDRKYGYGGYHYDGRWKTVAREIADYYNLGPGNRVLDVGCGKAFLLYELKRLIPDLIISGVDVSSYAIENARAEIKNNLQVASAVKLPFGDASFDLVISINTFHNLYCYDLYDALKEMQRVGKKGYICVESYRNEREKANLLYWQLTCECFFTPQEWQWWYGLAGYTGDYSFIYFE